MNKPALALIEFKSVARGIIATDAIAKKAPIEILATNPICPGKYLVIFTGDVADVEESLNAGLEVGGDMVINSLFLPNVHTDIIPAVTGTIEVEKFGAVGIIESFSVASCIVAADKAAKMAPVFMVEIRLANGLGGKAYFVITGELPDVEAALETAKEHVTDEGLLAGCEIIPSPHPDLIAKGVYWAGM
ncbi:MAG: BMC domain-containing protein [Gammaproteobacteria bacterium]|nr:BMC domain-containing protein [Gammaproteobacteria bacterium]